MLKQTIMRNIRCRKSDWQHNQIFNKYLFLFKLFWYLQNH